MQACNDCSMAQWLGAQRREGSAVRENIKNKLGSAQIPKFGRLLIKIDKIDLTKSLTKLGNLGAS